MQKVNFSALFKKRSWSFCKKAELPEPLTDFSDARISVCTSALRTGETSKQVMSRTCVVRYSALSWTSERLDCHFDLRNRRKLPQISLFGWWLQYSSFCDREEIQVNRNTNTSRDFIAWNSCWQTSWACYRGCWTKSKKYWQCFSCGEMGQIY